MEELDTFSVSLNLCRNSHDYELETLIEAHSATAAAVTLTRDWADLIKETLARGNELVISVSSPNGDIQFFTVHSNLCIPLNRADTIS